MLQCFAEVSRVTSSRDQVSTFFFHLKETSPIVYLGIIGANQENTEAVSHAYTLIVVHQNGEIRCLSGDLSQEYWNSSDKSRNDYQEGQHVEYAVTLSVDQARRALLNNREDILSLLGADLGSSADSPTVKNLLALVTKNHSSQRAEENNTLNFRLFSIGPDVVKSDNLSLGRKNRSIEELTSLELPTSYLTSHKSTKLFLHEGSGCLYQHWEKSLAIYNLTSLIPQLETSLELDHEIYSCLRLGPSLVALSSPSFISVIDVRFKSLQASLSIDKSIAKPIDLGVEDHKHQSPVDFCLLTFFSPLEMIIGLQGSNLISYQITGQNSSDASTRKRKREGLLIEAIGRGMKCLSSKNNCSEVRVKLPPRAKSAQIGLPKEWEDKQKQLDEYADVGDWNNFDQIMSMELNASNPLPMNILANSTSTDRSTTELRQNRSAHTVRLLTRYALSKIFTVKNEQAVESASAVSLPMLKIVDLPPKTFSYLIQAGHMTLQLIESTLKETQKIPTNLKLASNALIEALVMFDPCLKRLIQLIKAPNNLTSRELVHALGVGIRSMQKLGPREQAKLITNGAQNINTDHEVSLERPLEAGDEQSEIVIKEATKSLYGHNESDIRKAMKQVLSRTELIVFVDTLRIELANGGWLSQFADTTLPSESKEATQNDQITVIAQLLNCAIDSLGTGGLIFGSSTTDDMLDTGDTISYMQAEVSAALEGIEEAAYLEGLLGEALLYCKSARPVKLDGKPSRPKKKKQKRRDPVVIPLGDELRNTLPLGMRPEKSISLTRIGAGGEIQKRTQREIARLMSRRVGKYSFEKIFL